MDLAQAFFDLFKGSDIAHGTFVVNSNRVTDGKKQGIAKVIREPTTIKMWEEHLKGGTGVGIIPIKSDNLCLGGGCALNITTNSKIIEQGIYKNVHVNTAPNEDGLHFGAALYKAAEYENEIILPDDIGYLGIPYTDEDIELALC